VQSVEEGVPAREGELGGEEERRGTGSEAFREAFGRCALMQTHVFYQVPPSYLEPTRCQNAVESDPSSVIISLAHLAFLDGTDESGTRRICRKSKY
jgi:hypothetical protein